MRQSTRKEFIFGKGFSIQELGFIINCQTSTGLWSKFPDENWTLNELPDENWALKMIFQMGTELWNGFSRRELDFEMIFQTRIGLWNEFPMNWTLKWFSIWELSFWIVYQMRTGFGIGYRSRTGYGGLTTRRELVFNSRRPGGNWFKRYFPNTNWTLKWFAIRELDFGNDLSDGNWTLEMDCHTRTDFKTGYQTRTGYGGLTTRQELVFNSRRPCENRFKRYLSGMNWTLKWFATREPNF